MRMRADINMNKEIKLRIINSMTAIVHDESACILPSIIKLILLGELLRIKGRVRLSDLIIVVLVLAIFLQIGEEALLFSLYAPAHAHFFGATKTVNGYQIVFQPAPSVPLAGDNSTLLNFSVLDKDNQNVNNIFASLIIREKNSGNVVKVFPFKFYEFSDLTFPFSFKKIGDYVVTLQTRINGDPIYGDNPLSVDFDLSAGNPNQIIPFDELITYYVIPASVVILAIAIYLRRKNKI
jgi:hypothetical protein